MHAVLRPEHTLQADMSNARLSMTDMDNNRYSSSYCKPVCPWVMGHSPKLTGTASPTKSVLWLCTPQSGDTSRMPTNLSASSL